MGPESFYLQCIFLRLCINISLSFSQGHNVFVMGGLKSVGGIKSCKYVHKYFFVFLSTQFLSIVFLNTAKSLQVHCKPQTILFLFNQIFSEDSGCWMKKGVS